MESDKTKIAVLVEKVGNMNVTLSKLDAKLDSLNEKFATKEQVLDLERQVAGLDKKVISLENWRVIVIGVATAMAVLANFAKDWFLRK